MRPALTVALGIVAALGLVRARRRRRGTGAFALLLGAAILAGIQVAPRATSRSAQVPDASPSFTVLTANMLRSSVAPSVLVELVRRTQADVVALPETNADRAQELARALSVGRGERWLAETDSAARSPDDGTARPTAIVVREALGPRRLPEPVNAPGAHGQVRVRLTTVRNGRGQVAARPGPTVVALHPLPPAPQGSQLGWRRDLLRLRHLCRAGWVLAGDFNATVDHSPVRALLHSGCRDAAAVTGQGLKPTWSGGPMKLVRPAIDHVLTSGRWRTAAAGVLRIDGSDHRAVWARVFRQQSD